MMGEPLDRTPGPELTTPALTTVVRQTGLFGTGRIETGTDRTVTLVEPPAPVPSVTVSTTDGISAVSGTDPSAFVMRRVRGCGAVAASVSGGLLLTAAACIMVLRQRTFAAPTASSGQAQTG